MLRRLSIIVFSLFIFAGCSNTRSVTVDGSQGMQLYELNKASRGKVARVTMKNGEGFDAMSVQVAADSTSWIDPEKNTFKNVATSEIQDIAVIKAGKGAIHGLLLGAVSGAAAGLLRASLQGDDPDTDPIGKTVGEKMVIYPAAHAVYFSLISTPIGAIVGRKDHYQLNVQATPPAETADAQSNQ